MKLCILSNAHAGALKAAWPTLAESERAGVEPTFFAAKGALMRHLGLESGRLCTRNEELRKQLRWTSGGLQQVDPRLYDAFWIHGLGFAHLTWPGPPVAPYSQGFLTALTLARIKGSQALRLHALLRGLTRKPVVLTPSPMHSEAVAPADVADVPLAPRTADLELALQSVVGELTTLLFQPKATLTRRYYTARAYADPLEPLPAQSGDASEERPRADFEHMNARYGALVWRQVLGHLPRG